MSYQLYDTLQGHCRQASFAALSQEIMHACFLWHITPLVEYSLLEAPYCLLGGLKHGTNLAQQTSQPDSKGMKAVDKHITTTKRVFTSNPGPLCACVSLQNKGKGVQERQTCNLLSARV